MPQTFEPNSSKPIATALQQWGGPAPGMHGGETLETLPIKPQSDAVAPASELEEEAPGTAELMVQIARRLLHVLTGILILLSAYTFYVSSPVLIPLTLAVLITMLLSPAVSLLERLEIPRPLSAAVAIAILLGILGGGAYSLSGPAQEWLQKLPQSGGKIDRMLRSIKKPFGQIEQASEHLSSTTEPQNASTPQKVQLVPPGLTERVAGGTAQLAAALSVIFILVFFLLSSGDTFLRKLVSVIPTFADKKRTVETIRSIESDISFYLVMLLLVNVGLGLGVVLITAVLGIPDPLLWGALTVILSFAPYVGEMAIAATLLIISMVTFDTLGKALIAPAAYIILMSSVHITVPVIVKRRLLLNPVAVFIAIIFLGWIWGMPGALLAVPLLASCKIICQRIEHLNAIAAFLTP
jgi:predicted PurR-regulated permease PerM